MANKNQTTVEWLREQWANKRCLSLCSEDFDEAILKEQEQAATLKAENFRLRDVLEELIYHCTTENGIDRSAFDKALDKAEEILKGGNNESR